MYPGPQFITVSGKVKSFVSGPTTERLLIIGTAVDGPINKPQKIDSTVAAEAKYGPAIYAKGYKDPVTGTENNKYNGATLPLAIAQAIAAGCTDIWCMRATGTIATAASAFGNTLDIRGLNPGRIYNEVTISTSSTGGVLSVLVQQPGIRGINYLTTYASSLTIGEVIDKINGDPRNNSFRIAKNTWASTLNDASTTIASGSATLTGGTNGTDAKGEDYATSLDGYATKLTAADTGTFAMLKGTKFDFQVCVLTGIHIDDQVVTEGVTGPAGSAYTSGDEYETSIVSDFILFLDEMSSRVAPCHGVIGTRPHGLEEITDIISYVDNNLLSETAGKYQSALRWIKAGYFLKTGYTRGDDTSNSIDLGRYVSVVAGPDVIYSYPGVGNYTDNWHVSYAAMLTTLPPERAPILKSVPAGIVGYTNPYPSNKSDALLDGVGFDPANEISGKGAYVVLVRDPRNSLGPLVIYSDPTMAARDDYLRQYQVNHLVNHVHRTCWLSLINFMGYPTDQTTLAAMDSTVQNIMDGYVKSKALKGQRGVGYDFRIKMDGLDQFLGVVRIEMEINPSTALQTIVFTITVRQSI